MTTDNLKRRAGINEQREAEGDPILLTDSLLRSLKRYRRLSEQTVSKSIINDAKNLKRMVAEQEFGPELFRIKELAGLFEEDEREEDESDSKDNEAENKADYGYETDNSGNEKGSNSAVKTEMAALHSDMMDCLTSLRTCVMDCTIDGTEVPSAIRTTIDKMTRAIDEMEQLAGKV
jgi:hypothetical protein